MTKNTRVNVAVEGVKTDDGSTIIEPEALQFHEEDVPITQGAKAIGRARNFQRDDKGVISAEIEGTIPKGLVLEAELFVTWATESDSGDVRHVRTASVVALNAKDATSWAALND